MLSLMSMVRAKLALLGSGAFPLLALVMLASGAALLVAIVFGVALGRVFGACLIVVVPLACLRIRYYPASLRTRLARQTRTGLVIGACATVSYDLSRWLLVHAFSISFNPFAAFPLFGWGIGGAQLTRPVALAIGVAYHIINGLSFALSYCLLLGGGRWQWGVVWALALELVMFSVYPGWLDLKGVMVEFTTVSLTGHVAYGATLGLLSERYLPRRGLRSVS
jgi:hypothetical protein